MTDVSRHSWCKTKKPVDYKVFACHSSKKMKGNILHTVLKNGSDSYEEFMNNLESVAGGMG